jgi:2-keto-4-pentenoate hydratase/2-oxohepta-3-ene-1,7-dioic acid hydratase in catechol pathway
VAIGRNYVDHNTEQDEQLPLEPLVFAKLPGSVIGPGEPIEWDPGATTQVDWEAELGVVIGSRARSVSREQSLRHVFGYTCINDVSARDMQFADKQWVRSKSLDTFCPMGPFLVTGDELDDPQSLGITCRVNDETMQEANTADMIFSVADIVSYCSQNFTLHPGDVIATGTPGGVGVFRKPPRFLRNGDTVEVEIESIGLLSNPVRVPEQVPRVAQSRQGSDHTT